MLKTKEQPTRKQIDALIRCGLEELQAASGKTILKGRKVRIRPVNLVADQPVSEDCDLGKSFVQAKRLAFGMRHFNSENACTYCIESGKQQKPTLGQGKYFVAFQLRSGATDRRARGSADTDQDIRDGRNGFFASAHPPAALSIVYPYDTPIDVLHNLGEGLGKKVLSGK